MTPEEAARYWQEQAIKRVGLSRINAAFELRFMFNTEGGIFRASFNDVVSGDIFFPPSADQLKAALEAMITIGANGVNVKGVLRGPYEIEITGANSGQVVPPLLIDGTELEPPQEVIPARLQQGNSGNYWGDVLQYWENHAEVEDLELRSLLCAFDLVQLRLGELADEYDVESGQVNRVMERRSQRVGNMKDRERSIQQSIITKQQDLGAGARRPFRGEVAATSNDLPPFVLGLNAENGRLQ